MLKINKKQVTHVWRNKLKSALLGNGIYLAFNLSGLLVYSGIISFAIFFHFMLGHRFYQIESWLKKNAWHIIILTKVMCYFFYYQFFKVKFLLSDQKIDHFKMLFRLPSHKIIFLSLYFLLCFYFGGTFIWLRAEDLSTLNLVFSYTGNVLFFLIDFLIIIFIARSIEELKSTYLVYYLLVLAQFYFFSSYIYNSLEEKNIMLLLNMFTCLYIYEISGKAYYQSFNYLLIFVGFSVLFFGQDLVFGDQRSLLQTLLAPSQFYLILNWIVAWGILTLLKKINRYEA